MIKSPECLEPQPMLEYGGISRQKRTATRTLHQTFARRTSAPDRLSHQRTCSQTPLTHGPVY
uniref:Uncharacterized protein n=1 Tax=Anguilla anguilla TaxID=7936 RepID=A0A0E9X2P6_ANGAN